MYTVTHAYVTYIYRNREKLGVVRVSTAYEFYQAVKDHLVFKEKAFLCKPKAPFEATNYILYYFAANEQDAEGKICDYVLDRSKMWDNSEVPGCKKAFEFIGLPFSKLKMRDLPCPCAFCCRELYDRCTNRLIVSNFSELQMRRVAFETPEYLHLPLEGNRLYTVGYLKAFMRRHDKRVPGSIKKDDLIQLIMTSLGDYLLPAV